MSKNILVLMGGGGAEHEISKISAKYLVDQLAGHKVTLVEITKSGWIENQSKKSAWLIPGKKIQIADQVQDVDYVIPCLHGTPGETGEIQPLLESFNLPYFGCDSWTSSTLFNKVTTKLWCDQVGIPNTPYVFLAELNDKNMEKVYQFFDEHKSVFIKAASQGSSVGCFTTSNKEELKSLINKAFQFSKHVLVEKKVKARELEVAAYQYQGKWHFSYPGEILVSTDHFYDFEEKYSKDSQTQTTVKAEGLTSEILDQISKISELATQVFKIRHLSRIDFFLTDDNQVYLNEINTFPGLTPISMFPKMMEANKHPFKDYLLSHIA